MCEHLRYTIDAHEQTGYCHDCQAEGRMVFVVGGLQHIQKLEAALRDACNMLDALAGNDNSCDPSPVEELAEWRALVPNVRINRPARHFAQVRLNELLDHCVLVLRKHRVDEMWFLL